MSTDIPRFSKNNFDPAQWVSQSEAAEIRGVSRQAIARLLKKGRFTTFSIGGKILLKRSEVEQFKPKPPGPPPKKKATTKPRKRRH
jgi:excisionase family DNA binding protein